MRALRLFERFASDRERDFAQLQINYYDWNYSSAKEEYQILGGAGNIPIIIVMEPVRGGRLADLTPEANAVLKAAHPDWEYCLLGSEVREEFAAGTGDPLWYEHDGAAGGGPGRRSADGEGLSGVDREILEKACEMFKSQIQVPCTACRYCCSECPMEINIPEYMKLYNAYKVDGPWALKDASKIESQGKPSDCIGCGACTGHCPQNIEVPKIMEELADLIKPQ